MIESISCFELMSIIDLSSGKSKRIVFGSIVITSFLPPIHTPIITMTLLTLINLGFLRVAF